MSKILVIDDERSICKAFDLLLTDAGHSVAVAGTIDAGFRAAREQLPDVIILDIRLPDGNGLDALPKFRSEFPDAPVIVITAHGGMATGIEAMKRGAYNYITKPPNNDEIIETVARATERKNLSDEIQALREQLAAGKTDADTMVGSSPEIQSVYKKIGAVATTDATVLITGESGVGKELVAEAIHKHSARASGPFRAVNCAGLPETLIESELYGHVKGAFTGAVKDREGRAKSADGGTLFLDEIAEIPTETQAKLLRFIETRSFEPVGSAETIAVDVRIIAATNRNLERRISEERFREDLYYRLNVVEIHVPPLRDRKEDIPLLVAHFLSQPPGGSKEITRDAAAALEAHLWPGNVRELKHAIQHAVVVARGEPIRIDHLPAHIIGKTSTQETAGANVLDASVRALTETFLASLRAGPESADGAIYEIGRAHV